jgi:hypothetical protein
MDLDQLFSFVDRLRKETIGKPRWIAKKQVFEYREASVEVVAVLKLCRAAHGLSAMRLLCQQGLFIDMGAIARCVGDCADEIYFLLENYPNTSPNVDKFIKGFFEQTIDKDLLSEGTPPVPTKKIRSAVVRILKGQHDQTLHDITEKIYKAFSGYIHANYVHIMEVYSGLTDNFNLRGVPSASQRRLRMAQVEAAADSVLNATAFIARTLGRDLLFRDIVESWH